jgi:hypothetical protein
LTGFHALLKSPLRLPLSKFFLCYSGLQNALSTLNIDSHSSLASEYPSIQA